MKGYLGSSLRRTGLVSQPLILFILFIFISLLVALPKCQAEEVNRPIRALHFDLLGISKADAMRLVDMAAAHHFNCLIVDVLWGASVHLESFPWQVKGNPWKKADLVKVIDYARRRGLDVVPQMPLLSHQRALLGKYRPDLMYNQSTYDPDKPEVYRLIIPMLDELLGLFRPKAFLIGHDEVVGWDQKQYGKFLSIGQHPLPVGLFIKDVKLLHAYLKSKGVETWMWGDMLLSPGEFPGVAVSSVHGGMPGYGKDLRMKMPRDIIICDWHYDDTGKEFPSLLAFRAAGFHVLGSTWDDVNTTTNFSRYAALHGADGMIATTWFYLQDKKWSKIVKIISSSGDAFERYFPNEK